MIVRDVEVFFAAGTLDFHDAFAGRLSAIAWH